MDHNVLSALNCVYERSLNLFGRATVAKTKQIGRQFTRPFLSIFDREFGGMERVTR